MSSNATEVINDQSVVKGIATCLGGAAEYNTCTLVMAEVRMAPGMNIPQGVCFNLFASESTMDINHIGFGPTKLTILIRDTDLMKLKNTGIVYEYTITQTVTAAIVETVNIGVAKKTKYKQEQVASTATDAPFQFEPGKYLPTFLDSNIFHKWLMHEMRGVLHRPYDAESNDPGVEKSLIEGDTDKTWSASPGWQMWYVPLDLLASFEKVVYHSGDLVCASRSVIFRFQCQNIDAVMVGIDNEDPRVRVYKALDQQYLCIVPFSSAVEIYATLAFHRYADNLACINDPQLADTLRPLGWFIDALFGPAPDESLAVQLIETGRVELSSFIIDSENSDRSTPIYLCAKKGWLRLLTHLLNSPFKNAVNYEEYDHTGTSTTALFIAAERGDHQMVECLLAHGADWRKVGRNLQMSPLFVAAAKGHCNVVRILIEKGQADPNQSNKYGVSPLTTAIDHKHADVVRLLLERGVNALTIDSFSGQSCFMQATQSSCEILDLLVQYGATTPPAEPADLKITRQCNMPALQYGRPIIKSKTIIITSRPGGMNSSRPGASSSTGEVIRLESTRSWQELFFAVVRPDNVIEDIEKQVEASVRYRIGLFRKVQSGTGIFLSTPWQNACLAGNQDILKTMEIQGLAPRDLDKNLIERLQALLELPTTSSGSQTFFAASGYTQAFHEAVKDTLFLCRCYPELMKGRMKMPDSVRNVLCETSNEHLKTLLSCYAQEPGPAPTPTYTSYLTHRY